MPDVSANPKDVVRSVRRALASEPRIAVRKHPVDVHFEGGALALECGLPSVAAKKLALGAAAICAPEAEGIIDRLHVIPSVIQQDGGISNHVRDALLGEPDLADLRLYVRYAEQRVPVRVPDDARGEIEIAVSQGRVTLDGEVPSLIRKRLAGVLAWWVPGCRDVINGLGVEPPEVDNDFEIVEAVRVALEKDPFINASQIRVAAGRSIVTLMGAVATESERAIAEEDAWYVFGVDEVINRLEVRR